MNRLAVRYSYITDNAMHTNNVNGFNCVRIYLNC